MKDAVGCARLFLIAENRLLREALTRVLAKKDDLDIVGTASFTPAMVETIIAASPDLLLFDPPEIRTGLVFLRRLREAMPILKIVMIGMETSSESLVQAVREGISGYLLLDASASEIVAAVRFIINGGAVCPPELCQALFSYVAAQKASLPNFAVQDQLGLTRREQQLVQMVSHGFTNKEIAAKLNLSEQTVKNHVHSMMRKVGVRNRLQAVETIRVRGLLPAQ
jgi:DNA-binding NarL/FixJ family response regulator